MRWGGGGGAGRAYMTSLSLLSRVCVCVCACVCSVDSNVNRSYANTNCSQQFINKISLYFFNEKYMKFIIAIVNTYEI